MKRNVSISIRMQIENLLSAYWSELPEPKPTYTEWFYGENGAKDLLDQIFELQSTLGDDNMFDETILQIKDYDPGLLNDYGGGDVNWWFDYIRAEINRCNEYWREAIENHLIPNQSDLAQR